MHVALRTLLTIATKMKYLRILGAMLALVSAGPAFAAEPETVKPEIQYVQFNGRWVVRLSFIKHPSGKVALRALTQTPGAPFDAASYLLADAEGKQIAVKPLPPTQPGLLNFVLLEPASPLKVEDHSLKILADKMFLVADGKTNALPETELKLTKQQIEGSKRHFERDQAFVTENSVELAGGSAGGTATIRLSVERNQFAGLDWAGFRVNGSADLALDGDDRDEFFNNISGELDFFAPLLIGENSANPRYSELSGHAKTESDQEFETTDGVAGVRFAIYPKDPVTRWLGTLFVPTNNHLGPLVIVGYDYAKNLAGDPDANAAASGINTERANHRLNGLLRWRVPLLENFDFSFLPALGGNYNVDLDLELKGVYNINAERFLDQSRASIQFSRTSTDRFKPAFVFTWARGKEAPTWKEINVLLAGLMVSF